MLHIKPIPAFHDNYIWCLVDDTSSHCLIVDPGDANPVIQTLEKEGLLLQGILLTHHHHDHVGGVEALLKQYPAMVYGPARDGIAGMLNHHLVEGDIFQIMGLDFHVMEIPGHTLGHIAYFSEGMLFCGDTLFLAGCGRLFEGTAEQMQDSLNKITSLVDDTQVYCGHEYTENNLKFAQLVEPDNKNIQTRLVQVRQQREKNLPTVPGLLSLEKETNPFLRCHLPQVKRAAEAHSGEKLNKSVDVFRILRQWKDHTS